MTQDMTFLIELGGRRWELRPLPWRIVCQVQPGLMRQFRHFGGGDPEVVGRRLDEGALKEQTRLLALALSTVEPGMTEETLGDLHFAVADLALGLVTVMRACGVDIAPADETPALAEAAAPETPAAAA